MPLPLLPLIPVIASLVPEAVKWIAGDKAGAVAEQVTGIARDVFGSSDPADIDRAIAANPDAALQFKMAVLSAQAASEQEETKRLLAHFADVASARMQTVELAKSGSIIAWGAPVVSVLVTVGFFLMLWLVLNREVPDGSRDIANILLGSLGASFTAVIGYWVGSSAGSAQKTAAIEKALTR